MQQDQENLNGEDDKSMEKCPSPRMRLRLRVTAARTSIMSGGKPYKEVGSSSKKLRSRKKAKKLNSSDTSLRSNDTFVRHEGDIFDRDSLDPKLSLGNISGKLSAPRSPDVENSFRTPNASPEPQEQKPIPSNKKKSSIKKLIKTPGPVVRPRAAVRPRSEIKPRLELKMRSNVKLRPDLKLRSDMKPRKIVTNNFTRPRPRDSQRYKSTAELEKEYFSSLRSRF